MSDRAKCSRCGLELELELVLAELCLGCLGVLATDGAVLLSVDADLRARAVPHDARAAIVRALLEHALRPRLAGSGPGIAEQVLEAQLATRRPMIGARCSSERLEAAAIIGAGEWERYVAEADASPGRLERLLEVRPYRRQVVRLILEGLTRCQAITWS